VLFHLDTGATCTMITGEDARALGLAPDGRPAVKGYIADGSMVELERVVLPSLAVGGAEVHNLEVVIGKMRLLGMDFLREFHLTVDAGGGQLVLERKRGAPEREDPSIADEKSRARSGLENQIEQMELAIASKRSYIDELTADIREEGEKRARVERALHDAHQRTRFEGSDISADESTRRSIEKYEEAMARLDRYIEMRHNDITIQQKQIEQLQGTIEHYERLMTGM
jgi:prefoldin subunit 5